MDLRESTNYRDFLKSELERRLQVNPRYSLRSFARDLKISPQALSLVLNGKRGLSLTTATKIGQSLGLLEEDQSYFNDLVIYTQAKSTRVRNLALSRMNDGAKQPEGIRILKDDLFRVISDWYHLALLELTFVKGFQSQPRWIASQLGISEHEVKMALERLLRLGLLELSHGRLQKTNALITTPPDVPSLAIRKFHSQLLEKGRASLELDPIEVRNFTTTTMAIDPKELASVKPLIRQFHRKIMNRLERGTRSQVYAMTIELFPLSKNPNSRRILL